MNLSTLLFSFSGRINRGKYWLAILIYVIIWVIVAAIFFLGAMASMMAVYIIGIIIYIPMLISGIAIGIKRLHDRDKSGWWLIVFYLVPGILGGVGNMLGSESIQLVLGLISLAIAIWAFVELGCLRGTIGPNQYGPDPLGQS